MIFILLQSYVDSVDMVYSWPPQLPDACWAAGVVCRDA